MLRPQDNPAREAKRLDGLWDFAVDPTGVGRRQAWWRGPLPAARPVAVPASYNDLFADRAVHDLVGDAWYQRTIHVPRGWDDRRVVLRFDAAALRDWDWKHRAAWGERMTQPYAAGDLGVAMRQNPRLRVLSLNGYYDLATPFFATEFALSHIHLDPALRGNVQIRYYDAGHMIYLDDASLHAMRIDLERFYALPNGTAIVTRRPPSG